MRDRAPYAQGYIQVPSKALQQVTEGAEGPQTWGRHSQKPLPPMTLSHSKSREKAAHVSSSVGRGGSGLPKSPFGEVVECGRGVPKVHSPALPHRSCQLTPLILTSTFPIGTPNRRAEGLASREESQGPVVSLLWPQPTPPSFTQSPWSWRTVLTIVPHYHPLCARPCAGRAGCCIQTSGRESW